MNATKYPVDNNLEDWFAERSEDDFPKTRGDDSYHKRYRRTKEHLAKIHKNVEICALLADLEKAYVENRINDEQITYLNKHDQEHVATVVEKASELLTESKCAITPYECYLLLMAIQFHDTGNVFGRENHEKKCWDIMREIGDQIGQDQAEKRAIIKIAAVHGGNVNGDKDTISNGLEKKTDLMDQKDVRMTFLAAILRFADELADDRTRANQYLLKEDRLPRESKIHHLYSSCLHTVIIKHYEVNLVFEFEKEEAREKYQKKGDEIFLLDEIYARTLKMHRERIYCMRFLRPYVEIERINVKISIFDDENVFDEPTKISYYLEEKGYPEYPNECISNLCPHLASFTGQKICDKLFSPQRTWIQKWLKPEV